MTRSTTCATWKCRCARGKRPGSMSMPASSTRSARCTPTSTTRRKIKELVALGADAIFLKDPSGLLTPERAATLIPVAKAACGTLPLQLHSHCLTGLAPYVALQAVKLGVDVVHTATSTLANGASHPADRARSSTMSAGRVTRPASICGWSKRSPSGCATSPAREGKPVGAHPRVRRLPLRAPDAGRHDLQPEVAARARWASPTSCRKSSKRRRACAATSAIRSSSARSRSSS